MDQLSTYNLFQIAVDEDTGYSFEKVAVIEESLHKFAKDIKNSTENTVNVIALYGDAAVITTKVVSYLELSDEETQYASNVITGSECQFIALVKDSKICFVLHWPPTRFQVRGESSTFSCLVRFLMDVSESVELCLSDAQAAQLISEPNPYAPVKFVSSKMKIERTKAENNIKFEEIQVFISHYAYVH
jgi:hypothetical protein